MPSQQLCRLRSKPHAATHRSSEAPAFRRNSLSMSSSDSSVWRCLNWRFRSHFHHVPIKFRNSTLTPAKDGVITIAAFPTAKYPRTHTATATQAHPHSHTHTDVRCPVPQPHRRRELHNLRASNVAADHDTAPARVPSVAQVVVVVWHTSVTTLTLARQVCVNATAPAAAPTTHASPGTHTGTRTAGGATSSSLAVAGSRGVVEGR